MKAHHSIRALALASAAWTGAMAFPAFAQDASAPASCGGAMAIPLAAPAACCASRGPTVRSRAALNRGVSVMLMSGRKHIG